MLATILGMLVLPAQAAPMCDLGLVLALDVSGSVDPGEWDLERDGTAHALLDDRVIAAIRSGPHGRIAIAVTQWSSDAVVAIGWRIVDGFDAAEDLAAEIAAMPRLRNASTGVGSAIEQGIAVLQDAPCRALRLAIDLSSDGRANTGDSVPQARMHAIVSDITVNALVILDGTEPGLEEWYRSEVVTPGGFALVADGFAAYAQALRAKLVLEVAGVPVHLAEGR